MHTARRMNTTGYVSGAMRILKSNFNGRQNLTRIKEIQGILMDEGKMMKPGAKRILNVILYTMIGITGVLAIIWHFLSVAATLKLAINGADMTTWIKDPYIECLEWLIVSTCLFGIYSLFSLLVLRKKKEMAYAGVIAVSVSTVVSVMYAFCVTYINFPSVSIQYAMFEPNHPSHDFFIFLKYAIQPIIIFAVCFILFGISKHRLNRNG